MQTDTRHPFDELTPDLMIDAVESQNFISDGRFLALNSYENRVYQVGIEGQDPMIAKFYRPQRWTDAQIDEEHAYCFQLLAQELPVVAPWVNVAGHSLHRHSGYVFSLYTRRGGRAPELADLDNLLILGRLMGRIHGVGSMQSFAHRPTLDVENFGWRSYRLISQRFMIPELQSAYDSLALDVLKKIDQVMADYGPVRTIRVHGDCHSGNILWRDDNPHFVDFDDSRMAPAVQDLWMLLSGDRYEQSLQMAELVEGYNEFCDFDYRELRLIEVLRTLRMMHHSAWLAKRWDDPAFPRAFPWFGSARYWSDHILMLREQFAALDEPVLHI